MWPEKPSQLGCGGVVFRHLCALRQGVLDTSVGAVTVGLTPPESIARGAASLEFGTGCIAQRTG